MVVNIEFLDYQTRQYGEEVAFTTACAVECSWIRVIGNDEIVIKTKDFGVLYFDYAMEDERYGLDDKSDKSIFGEYFEYMTVVKITTPSGVLFDINVDMFRNA